MNLFRYENILLNQNGTPIVGVNVWVCAGNITPNFFSTPPGPLATVFNDILGTQPITQPLLTSPLGNYSFCAPPGTVCTVVFIGAGIQSSDIVTIPQVTNQTVEVDGVQYANLQQAFAGLPAIGGTIDMRGNSSAAALTLGTFDPGTAAVTILLGPFNYSLTQITVRTNLQVIGVNGTVLNQAVAGTPPFVLPSSGVVIAGNVYLANFSLQAAALSSTDGISMVAAANGGLFYSAFYNLTIGSLTPFGRNAIRFDSTSGGSRAATDQFNSIRNVFAFRKQNGQPVLMITGQYTGQLTVEDCQFDGPQGVQDTSANIYNIRIDDGGNSWLAYSIVMRNVTSQWVWGVGSAAIFLGGTSSISVIGGHFENCSGIIKEALGAGSHGNWGVSIKDSYIAASAVNAGNGFIASLDGNSSLAFDDNGVFGTPDHWVLGTATFFSYKGNMNINSGGVDLGFPVGFDGQGFGNGSSGTAVTTTTKNTGTGPTTPQTIVKYQQVTISGTVYWIPLCQ